MSPRLNVPPFSLPPSDSTVTESAPWLYPHAHRRPRFQDGRVALRQLRVQVLEHDPPTDQADGRDDERRRAEIGRDREVGVPVSLPRLHVGTWCNLPSRS